MTRLALIALLTGCTTLEGFESPFGAYYAFEALEDPARLAGGILRRDSTTGGLVLTTAVSAWCDASCQAKDEDLDSLEDDWEAHAIDHLRPALALREDEPSLLDGDGGLVSLARVAPGDQGRILVFYVFLWNDDAGRCSVGRHHGDTERIVFELTPLDGRGGRRFRVSGLYTSAHEGTATDASTTLIGADELATLHTFRRDDDDDDHVVVQVAAGKHAFYPREGQCPTSGSMCRRDLCAGLVVPWPVVLRTYDVGEPFAPKFPPHPVDAWSSRPYCGLLGRPLVMACAPAIAGKLLESPFTRRPPPPPYPGDTPPPPPG